MSAADAASSAVSPFLEYGSFDRGPAELALGSGSVLGEEFPNSGSIDSISGDISSSDKVPTGFILISSDEVPT